MKGINVLGTGDFTHPAWFAALQDSLVGDGSGFFTLKPGAEGTGELPVKTDNIPFRFCLQAEISSIYKKNGRTRKVHSVIFAPDLESVARINARLSALGNIKSDGRPILGLDPRNLLEIILEVSPDCHLVPAHIWTPWFSLFGSKSGFDTIEECFEDLSGHIFALETGLSSDPAMNWRVSALDNYSLISNSDAHSPPKLMREANLFETSFTYHDMFRALQTKKGFLGTLEFFPEEGKYHFDGHRKCNICLDPGKSMELNDVCPVCGKPLTIGVMHRVMELADRKDAFKPPQQKDYYSIIPLNEILGEIMGKGPATKSVTQAYWNTVSALGNEYNVIMNAPLEEIASRCGMPLAEAVKRVRKGDITPKPGYDGEFGVIRVFSKDELEELSGQSLLFHFAPNTGLAPAYNQAALFEEVVVKKNDRSFVETRGGVRGDAPVGSRREKRAGTAVNEQAGTYLGKRTGAHGETQARVPDNAAVAPETGILDSCAAEPGITQNAAPEAGPGIAAAEPSAGRETTSADGRGSAQETTPAQRPGSAQETVPAESSAAQREIAEFQGGAAIVTAGPGTGKTHTLVSWICTALEKDRARPENILAITFTNKAALEMKQRLAALLGENADKITVCTFHALCFDIIRSHFPGVKSVYDRAGRRALLHYLHPGRTKPEIEKLAKKIEQYLDGSELDIDEATEKTAIAYQNELKAVRAVDIAALINEVNLIFEQWPQILSHYRERYTFIAVDEFQDINPAQYALISALIGNKPIETGGKKLLFKSVLAIGDPDQAIYAFRGADPRLFFRFQNDFQARHFLLSVNYRSVRPVIGAAGALINHNSFKSGLKLQAQRGDGKRLSVVRLDNEYHEAEYIAESIRTLVGGTDSVSVAALGPRTEQEYSFHDLAVLVRTHTMEKTLYTVFERRGIPVALRSEYSLLNEPPFSLLSSYLRLLYNRQDVIAFREVISGSIRGLSGDEFSALTFLFGQENGNRRNMLANRSLQKILAGEHAVQVEELLNFLEFVEVSIEFQGIYKGLFIVLEKIIPNAEDEEHKLKINALLELARVYQGDPAGFLRHMFLCVFESQGTSPPEKVHLLTFHAAKGLEFPVVFIAGAEEGITPLTGKSVDIEEERRLFYVSLTRAQDRVYITHCGERSLYGKRTVQAPSRFIDEIPPEYKEETAYKKKQAEFTQPSLF